MSPRRLTPKDPGPAGRVPEEGQSSDQGGKESGSTGSGDDQLAYRTGTAIFWSLLEKGGVRLVPLLIMAILARIITQADFGVISIATVVIALLNVFVDSGFSQTIIQRGQLTSRDVNTCFWTSVGYSLILYAALFIAAPALGDVYHMAALVPVLRVLGLDLLLGALASVPQALLQRTMEFKSLAVRQLAGVVAGGAAGVVVAVAGGGVWSLVAQTLGVQAVATAVLWMRSPWRPHLEYSFKAFKEMLPFAMGILGNQLLLTLQSNIDKLMLGLFFDARMVGIYFLAQQSTNILVQLATTVFGNVSLSTFSRIGQDVARRQRAYMRLTLLSEVVAFPVFGAMAALSHYYVPLLIAGNARGGVMPVFQLLLIPAVIIVVSYFDSPLLNSVGRPWVSLGISVLQNLVAIGLIALAAPHGLIWVALAQLVMRLVTWPVRLVSIHLMAGIRVGPFVLQVLRVLVCSVVPLGGVLLLLRTGWAAVTAGVWLFAVPVTVIYILVCAALIWLTSDSGTKATITRGLRSMLHRG